MKTQLSLKCSEQTIGFTVGKIYSVNQDGIGYFVRNDLGAKIDLRDMQIKWKRKH